MAMRISWRYLNWPYQKIVSDICVNVFSKIDAKATFLSEISDNEY
ncbi:MAG: hypothetical protein HeimC2_21950 [Candidatus Heimdallarchaeota archaeon LC_2]|nr:MAG: hypothetical protein HeimC2_21950 [Candidatus Heimdallarchaeota archaeon LC_2]